MNKLLAIVGFTLLLSCNGNAQKKETKEAKEFPVTKTEAEWKAQLTDIQYYVLREAGTEGRYSSPFNKNYDKGVYVCAGCDTPLFKSKHKYDSGSGWPSFDREIKGNVAYSVDYKIG